MHVKHCQSFIYQVTGKSIIFTPNITTVQLSVVVHKILIGGMLPLLRDSS